MNTYLWRVNYTSSGSEGLLKEGGSGRRTAIDELVTGLGGSIEAWYHAFGDADLYVIASLPSDVEAAAVNLRVAASGAAQIHTTVLLTERQIDDAAKASVGYRAPGA